MFVKLIALILGLVLAGIFFRNEIRSFLSWLFGGSGKSGLGDNPYAYSAQLESVDLQDLQDQLEAKKEELEILRVKQAAQQQLEEMEQKIEAMRAEIGRRGEREHQ